MEIQGEIEFEIRKITPIDEKVRRVALNGLVMCKGSD